LTGAGVIVVVGGGILGTTHALWALDNGFDVAHLETDLACRGASVRNFGLVWVGGRAGGPELELAVRARELWEVVAGKVPEIAFRPAGSLTIATNDEELALMEQALAREDSAQRQWELLDASEAQEVNPELSDVLLGALYCTADAIVEPRAATQAIQAYMAEMRGYTLFSGRSAVELADGAVRDDTGAWHRGDWVFVCTGARRTGLLEQYVERPPTRPVRLQMLQTAPYPGRVTTALADGDSMRYYPAFDLPARRLLGAQDEIAARSHAQLLVAQRVDGRLTIGDTHDYDEPFPFDLDEAAYAHLCAKAADLLRQPLPPVLQRWAGVYAEMLDRERYLYWREEIFPRTEVVNGPGGRGMTCSPAIAEASLRSLVARAGT
jgi:FAD dependent oxidoreductase TIGR03364